MALVKRTCGGPECDEPVQSKGLCPVHYLQRWKGQELRPIRRRKRSGPCPVVEDGKECGRPHYAKGVCNMHHRRFQRTGSHILTGTSWYEPFVNRNGYVMIWCPDHPHSYQPTNRLPEHRLVMEKMLGRYLLDGENVHHKNGVRNDNRPENLELWITQQPKGQRVQDLKEWARRILEDYADVDF